ncbi:unnamed protein product [Pieris macdunnoughi]|uniref:Uncharacterized protein n=1 Tax=Pieris macdunnoughi TaxID=345717 RepID=A0A821PRQ2_9NEOP|nr:unnamed protein product [Pieris macdunnoughi]
MNPTLLFLLVTATVLHALPTPDDKESTVEIIEVIGFVPVAVPLNESGTDSTPSHDVQKRSAVPEDLINNDLLGESEALQADSDVAGLVRRIKTLPSWVG